ncbi:MAG: metallophosphoesterase [Planctomycetota bacterium]
MISRRTFLLGALGCGIGPTAIGGYSRLIEPRWVDVNHIHIKVNTLPKRFEGFTIVQLSDIHHCKYVPAEFIRKCVRQVNALSPDIVALTGDFVHDSDTYLPSVVEELSHLKAKEGVFAVPGNHDNKELTLYALSKSGIRLLINELVPLYRKNDYILIAGVDDLWLGTADVDKTLRDVNGEPTIMLSHNPDIVAAIKRENVDFVMAGHTHGGQIYIPFVKPTIMYPQFDTLYISGMFRVGKTTLYVNKGIGTSSYPVRFLARPEISVFTLTG